MDKFNRFVLKVGPFKTILLVVLVSVFLSIFFTYFSIAFFFGLPQKDMPRYLLIAAIVPFLVAPIASFGFIHLLFKINSLEAETRYLATHDALTGLLSRRAFYEHAEQYLKVANRERNSIALMVADVDGLKQINDTYGHFAGDQVLKLVGKIITETVRESDIVGRVGGDEFIFCLSKATNETAKNFGNRLTEAVNESVFEYEGSQIKFGISVGIYADELAESNDLSDLIRKADAAMYEAKLKGKI